MNTVVITGATSGIGLEVAKQLAQSGFQVLGIGHSAAHCEQARAAVREAAPQADPVYFTADLMQQREVDRAADELTAYITEHCEGKLFALINNAGCARGYYMTNEEGYEQQFALNYLSGFLLTYHLLPLLKNAGGRVIMTSSRSHKGARVHWNDVMLTHHYNPLTAYKQSKLCDLLFAKGLNDRCAAAGVHAYAVDPGLVRTDIGNKGAGGLVNFIWSLRKLGGVKPEIPAQTYAFLCDPEQTPGELYYYLCKRRAYSAQVTAHNADCLFALSERLCGVTWEREAAK